MGKDGNPIQVGKLKEGDEVLGHFTRRRPTLWYENRRKDD